MSVSPLLIVGPKIPAVEDLCGSLQEKNPDVDIQFAEDLEFAEEVFLQLKPVVMLSTDIMSMLKFLLKHRQEVKKSSSKTVLYNDKGKLPQEVEDKLRNAGLTDLLDDKTPAKTLYYKTSLHLKALPRKDERGDLVLKRLTPKIEKKVTALKKSTDKSGEIQVETENGVIDSIVLEGFCNENEHFIRQAETIIDKIEDEEYDYSKLNDFSNLIGKVIETSSTLGLEGIFVFCTLTKLITDHVSQYNNDELKEIVVAILGDATSFLLEVIGQLRNGDDSALQNIAKQGLIKRLKWLADKFKIEAPKGQDSSIDNLLGALG